MNDIVVHNAFDRGPRVQVNCEDEPRTKQSFKDECNINNIMLKYVRTGILEHGNRHQAQYGDVPAVDFRAALETVLNAQEVFDELPAKIRSRFRNDPAEFLGFCEDPDNVGEAATLGLLKVAETPDPAPPPDPPPPPSPPAEP